MFDLSAKSARNAGIAQLVEHHLAKVEVASSSLVSRSNTLLLSSKPKATQQRLRSMKGNETVGAVLVRE